MPFGVVEAMCLDPDICQLFEGQCGTCHQHLARDIVIVFLYASRLVIKVDAFLTWLWETEVGSGAPLTPLQLRCRFEAPEGLQDPNLSFLYVKPNSKQSIYEVSGCESESNGVHSYICVDTYVHAFGGMCMCVACVSVRVYTYRTKETYIHTYRYIHIWSRAQRPPAPPNGLGSPPFCGVGCGGVDWEALLPL